MTMKRINQIEGKTIKTAERGGGDFADVDNRMLQLVFTDGTTFCVDVKGDTGLEREGIMFIDDEDAGRKIFRD